MGKITWYQHHGITVAVDEQLKGKHRNHCLCFRCSKFIPNANENCPIAQANYENCVTHGTTQPVYECPEFSEGNPNLSAL